MPSIRSVSVGGSVLLFIFSYHPLQLVDIICRQLVDILHWLYFLYLLYGLDFINAFNFLQKI